MTIVPTGFGNPRLSYNNVATCSGDAKLILLVLILILRCSNNSLASLTILLISLSTLILILSKFLIDIVIPFSSIIVSSVVSGISMALKHLSSCRSISFLCSINYCYSNSNDYSDNDYNDNDDSDNDDNNDNSESYCDDDSNSDGENGYSNDSDSNDGSDNDATSISNKAPNSPCKLPIALEIIPKSLVLLGAVVVILYCLRSLSSSRLSSLMSGSNK